MGSGTCCITNRRCLAKIVRKDQWNAMPASHSHLASPYASRESSLSCVFRFLKRERKNSTSRAILPMTPSIPEGFSSLFCLIQGSDFCCPHVVGTRKGTGALPHFRTR